DGTARRRRRPPAPRPPPAARVGRRDGALSGRLTTRAGGSAFHDRSTEMLTWRTGAAALLVCVRAAAEIAAAQGTPTTWLTRLGRDTIAFERFTRTPDRLVGDFVVTAPRSRLTHYEVRFERGVPVRFEI